MATTRARAEFIAVDLQADAEAEVALAAVEWWLPSRRRWSVHQEIHANFI